MTSSPTPPFDDGGDLPETSVADRDEGHGERGAGHPNYLVRRAIAVGVVIVVLAGGSVLAGRILDGGGGGDDDTAASADWNTVVVVAEDEVRLVDPESGDVTSTFPGDEALLDAESLTTGGQLVLLNEFGRITELDLADGTIRRTSAPDGSTLTVGAENDSIVLAGPPIGGEVAVVDTDTHVALDIGEVAGLTDPLMFGGDVLVNQAGSHVATADARSFQSVLVDVKNSTAVLLAGQVVALDDATVVTAQRAGAKAELEFYDLQGGRRGSADAPSPQVTMLTGDARALIVAADGTIAAVAANGDVETLGSIAGNDPDASPAEVLGGIQALGSERLLVSTADEVVLLDREGVVLTRATGQLLSAATRSSACAVIGSVRTTGAAIHLDLETGEVLGEHAGGAVGSTSADGCTASMLGAGPRVVVRGVEVDIGTTTGSITIAPDGSAYIVSTPAGVQLIQITVDDAEPPEPVDLATGSVLIRFAQV